MLTHSKAEFDPVFITDNSSRQLLCLRWCYCIPNHTYCQLKKKEKVEVANIIITMK